MEKEQTLQKRINKIFLFILSPQILTLMVVGEGVEKYHKSI